MNNVHVRAALSPTGEPHLGSVRTALFNYLYARANNGKFFIRIDDTDKTRTVAGSKEQIIKTLGDFGIRADAKPFIQSERISLYSSAAETLVQKGSAYYCFCTQKRLTSLREDQQKKGMVPRYDKKCLGQSKERIEERVRSGEKKVIRMNIPHEGSLTYNDYIRGCITVSLKEIDDQILLKSDGYPTYHLASVVDDNEMRISHIIRADEWLPSTPKHVLLFQAFSWTVPTFVHVPLIVSTSKKKLSKRDSDTGITYFLHEGYVLGALRNYIALLGWRPKEAESSEFFSLKEMEKIFTLDDLQKSPSVYDIEKLNWFNAHYIRNADTDELLNALKHFLEEKVDEQVLRRFLEVEKERLVTLKDIATLILPFSGPMLTFPPALLLWKGMDKKNVKINLEWVCGVIDDIKTSEWRTNTLEQVLRKQILDNEKAIGNVLWPLRVALSGVQKGPSPFACLYILGKEKSLERIKMAVGRLL